MEGPGIAKRKDVDISKLQTLKQTMPQGTTEADPTFGYGGTPAYGELQDGHQHGSQQWYGAQQHGHYQQNEFYQNADQQNDHHSNNQYDDQHSGYQNGYQQNSQEDDVGWSNSQNGWSQWDVRRSSPPSPVSATMGSGPSTAQTNSPNPTETFDNEAASTAGNADEDRIGPYVAEQPTVGMDERDDEDTANQAMEWVESCFPEYRNHDTRRQDQPAYSTELSWSDGSESGVTEPDTE
ncbi:hypothetical protein CEP54_003105 [Fusarium duplospermum]|uniref:Uncharacterized protein n=1 Tax=Fusarium duplospermum TaxID=1325734 RepID=A0A428QR35_9HYPO|nr:hypothetical protein CEP54_003105 [Fusarium duplospermum]